MAAANSLSIALSRRIATQGRTQARRLAAITCSSTKTPPSHRPYSSSPSEKRFSFHIAASFIGKDRPYDPAAHVFHYSPYQRIQQNPTLPPAKRRASRPDSGHDAFFVSRVDESDSVAFGLADGVGGWVDSGVDPADFSHGLCGYMAIAAHQHKPDGKALNARKVMQEGYDAICHDGSVRAGGSTACVGVVTPDGTLDLANLGDSGCLHLRLNGVHWYSEPQTHAFNTPYQLSLVPPKVAQRMAYFGGTQLSDLPRDADVSQHDLRHGDVIVLATDGVLDNLFNQDILRVAARAMGSTGAWKMGDDGVRVADDLVALTEKTTNDKGRSVSLQSLLATELVKAAKMASINTRVDGPFAKQVQKHFPQENWRGGKVDDICVVTVVVCEDGKEIKSKL